MISRQVVSSHLFCQAQKQAIEYQKLADEDFDFVPYVCRVIELLIDDNHPVQREHLDIVCDELLIERKLTLKDSMEYFKDRPKIENLIIGPLRGFFDAKDGKKGFWTVLSTFLRLNTDESQSLNYKYYSAAMRIFLSSTEETPSFQSEKCLIEECLRDLLEGNISLVQAHQILPHDTQNSEARFGKLKKLLTSATEPYDSWRHLPAGVEGVHSRLRNAHKSAVDLERVLKLDGSDYLSRILEKGTLDVAIRSVLNISDDQILKDVLTRYEAEAKAELDVFHKNIQNHNVVKRILIVVIIKTSVELSTEALQHELIQMKLPEVDDIKQEEEALQEEMINIADPACEIGKTPILNELVQILVDKPSKEQIREVVVARIENMAISEFIKGLQDVFKKGNSQGILTSQIDGMKFSAYQLARLLIKSIKLCEQVIAALMEDGISMDYFGISCGLLNICEINPLVNTNIFYSPSTEIHIAELTKNSCEKLKSIKIITKLKNANFISRLDHFEKMTRNIQIQRPSNDSKHFLSIKDIAIEIEESNDFKVPEVVRSILYEFDALTSLKDEKDKSVTDLLEESFEVFCKVNDIKDDKLEALADSPDLKDARIAPQALMIISQVRNKIAGSDSFRESLVSLREYFTPQTREYKLVETRISSFKMHVVEKVKEICDFLQVSQEKSEGTEHAKRKEISGIIQSSTIYFCQNTEKSKFTLIGVIHNDYEGSAQIHQENIDVEKLVELSKQEYLSIVATEDSLASRLIKEENFRSLQIKASFLSQFSESKESQYSVFSELANLALEILETLSNLAVKSWVIDMEEAFQFAFDNAAINTDKQVFFENKCIKAVIIEKNISNLRDLRDIVKCIEDKCKAEWRKVFIKNVEDYYPWSVFEAYQIKMLTQYLQSTYKNQEVALEAECKVRNLFSYTKTDLSLNLAIKNMEPLANIERVNQSLTFSMLDVLNQVFDKGQRSKDCKFRPIEKYEERQMSVEVYINEKRIEKLAQHCLIRIKKSSTLQAILFCNEYTSQSEVERFILQSTRDPLFRCYIVADCHLLDSAKRHILLTELANAVKRQDVIANTNVTLIVPADHSSGVAREIQDRYKCTFRSIDQVSSLSKLVLQTPVQLVISAYAGLGKTHYIERDASRRGLELLVLNLAGTLSPTVLEARLQPLFLRLAQPIVKSKLTTDTETARPRLALRVKIDLTEGVAENFDYLDQLLFKVCLLRCIECSDSIVGFEAVEQFYVEVQNTLDGRLLDMQFVRFLRQAAEQTDSQVTVVELAGPFEKSGALDFHALASDGLVESLMLVFLCSQGLEKFGSHLGEYLSPNSLTHISLREVIQLKKIQIGSDQDSQREVAQMLSCLERKLTTPWLSEDLSVAERAIVQEATQIDCRLKKLRITVVDGLSSASGLAIEDLLLGLAFSRESVLSLIDSKNLRDLTAKVSPRDAWLILRTEVRSNFEADFGAHLLAGPPKQNDPWSEFEDHYQESLLSMFSPSDDQDSQTACQLSDLNFYHVRVLLRLTCQFTAELGSAPSLDPGVYAGQQGMSRGDFQSYVQPLCRFRGALIHKLSSQTRAFAFEQIVPVAALQRSWHDVLKDLTLTADQLQDVRYHAVLARMQGKQQKSADCFFLRDGVLKHVYSGEASHTDRVADFVSRQQAEEIDLQQLSQQQFAQQLCEAFSELLSSQSTLDTGTTANNEMSGDEDTHSISIMATSNPSRTRTVAIKIDQQAIAARVQGRIEASPKRFLLTADNYLKMQLLLQRAEVGVPSVLLGESGCGKTFLIEFVAEVLLADSLRLHTFHSGVTETELA